MSTTVLLVHPDRGPAVVRAILSGPVITLQYGRAEQPQHVRVETLKTADAARQTFEDRVYRLVSKGYRAGHHHPGLIEAIAESPDVPDGYHVYADWLAERGDPRAQLIERTTTPCVSAELADILKPHRWQLMRRDWQDFEIVWWMGFVHTVRLRRFWGWWSPLRDAEQDGDTIIVRSRWARSLLLTTRRHPSGRFVRWVTEEYHVGRGVWGERTFALSFDFSVEPWIVRLTPKPTRGVNLNTASLQALMDLPGVGPTIAQRIVNRRGAEPFTDVAQLTCVLGLGRASVARLRDLVMV